MKKVLSVLLAGTFVLFSLMPCFASASQPGYAESMILLTPEEAEFVSAHRNRPLVVAVSQDLAPVEYYDSEAGAFSGFIIELYELISETTGLRFTYVPRGHTETTTAQIANGEIQLVGSLSTRPAVAASLNVTTTMPIFSNNVSLVSRNSWTGEGDTNSVVAVKAGYPVFIETAKSLGYTTIVEYESFAECVEAVNNGQADLTLISASGENVLLGHAYYANLTPILLTQTSEDYAIGVANNEDTALLLSIINKALASIPPDRITQMRLQWVLDVQPERTLRDAFYENGVFLFVVLMVAVLAVIAALLLRSRQKRLTNLALQESNESLQTALREKDAALKAAADANTAKSEFLSNMSHDIRTPMTAILNLTELSFDEMDQPELLKEDLTKIKLSGNYLMGLINDVLDMSRIESGKMTLNPSVYSHADFVSYMDSITTPLCEQKGVSFQWDKGSTAYDVYVDITRFNQVFYNLLSNAIKYTPPGGSVTLQVKNNQVIDGVLFCDYVISDTGIGMSEEFQKKLFTPFERADNVNAYAGTGLGLRITKQIIDLMHGTIHFDSKLGEGTTVTLRLALPVATELQCLKSLSCNASEDNAAPKCVRKFARILLADDNELNLEIITRLLQKKGYEVMCTQNGAEALAAFSESAAGYFSAIIMDIRMPVMDGYEATRAIRALDRPDAKTIPVIAMSANAYDEDVRKSLAAGMSLHLSKPIETAKLFQALDELIGD